MISSHRYHAVSERDFPFNIKGLTGGTSYSLDGIPQQTFRFLPIELCIRMLLRARGHPEFFQFNEGCRVLCGPAGRLLGTPLRANIDETESAAIITEQGGQENHRERTQDCCFFRNQFA